MTTPTVSTPIAELPPPPLAPGLPILGNMLEMMNDVLDFAVAQYQRLGPIFRIRALNQEMVVLAGPEANIWITQEGADKIRSYEAWTPFGKELDADSTIQNVDGELHVRLRKFMKRAYSASYMMSNLAMMVDIAQTALNSLATNTEIPVLTLFRLIVTEQLGRMAANHSMGTDLNVMSSFIKTALNVHIVKKTPALALKLPAYRRDKQRAIALGRDIIAEHRAQKRPQPDLIDDLIEASEREKDLFPNEGSLVTAALGPFIAGLDTASNECTFFLYELFKHPDILAQCVAEADQLFANGVPDSSQLRSLETIHYAMMETLRMHTIAPGVPRNAAKQFAFGGYRVDEGQALFLASAVPHYLPEIFPNPKDFDITRYMPPRNEHKKRGAYAPFGIGTHICLGAGAAEVQIMLAIATVLHLVKLEPQRFEQPIKIVADPTPTLGSKFVVKITERRHQLTIDPNLQPLAVSEADA